MDHLGARIKKMRREKGYTQAELARKARVSLSSLQRYESGERQPSVSVIEKISDVLGVFPGHFFPAVIDIYNGKTAIDALDDFFQMRGYEFSIMGEDWCCHDIKSGQRYKLSCESVSALNVSIDNYAIFSLTKLLESAEKLPPIPEEDEKG